MAASARRAELAATRRHRMSEKAKQQHERELARFERRKAKLAAAEQATEDAQRFDQYLQAIVELHKDCIDEWDWHDINSSPQPPAPVLTKNHENAARSQLDRYRPGLFARAFGRSETRVSELTQAVEVARTTDERDNAAILKRYQELVTTWDIERRIAKLVLASDPGGYQEALNYVDAFGDFNDFGAGARVYRAQADLLVVHYAVGDRELIPAEEIKANRSRTVSSKMPMDRYWSVFQDHVCSAALRIARDVCNVLPIKRVIVNVSRSSTNLITGYRVSETILAVRFWRSVLNQIDLQSGTPTDIVRNFQHRMSFQNAIGFEPVEAFTSEDPSTQPSARD